MIKYHREFVFTCEDEIEYHANGIVVKTNSLTLKAPSMNSQNAPLISQDIMRAFKEGAMDFSLKKQSENENEEIISLRKEIDQLKEEIVRIKKDINEDQSSDQWSSQDVLNALYMSKCINMGDFKSKFIKLLAEKNICLLDNQVPITQVHFEFIRHKEFNRLMGEYIANFLKP